MSQISTDGKKETASLPFFGIPRILPYIRNYRKTLLTMIVCGLVGSCLDIALPLFQRYALNHFIALGTLDTLPLFIVLYVVAIVAAAAAN